MVKKELSLNDNQDYADYCKLLESKSTEDLEEMINKGEIQLFTLEDKSGHLHETAPLLSIYQSRLFMNTANQYRKTNIPM